MKAANHVSLGKKGKAVRDQRLRISFKILKLLFVEIKAGKYGFIKNNVPYPFEIERNKSV